MTLAQYDSLRKAAAEVISEYDKWCEDANDGEFALYREDDIHIALLNLRRALAGRDSSFVSRRATEQ